MLVSLEDTGTCLTISKQSTDPLTSTFQSIISSQFYVVFFFAWWLKLAWQGISFSYLYFSNLIFLQETSQQCGRICCLGFSIHHLCKIYPRLPESRVQAELWMLVNPRIPAMQTAERGWDRIMCRLLPGSAALTDTSCGLCVDEFCRVVMRQVWEITQSTPFFPPPTIPIRVFVDYREAARLVTQWLTLLRFTEILNTLMFW